MYLKLLAPSPTSVIFSLGDFHAALELTEHLKSLPYFHSFMTRLSYARLLIDPISEPARRASDSTGSTRCILEKSVKVWFCF